MSERTHHKPHQYPPNQPSHYISPHTVKLRSPSKECPMNVIVYKNQPHQNGFYEQPNLPPAAAYHQQTLMHRSATQNHLSNASTPNKDSNSLHNWPAKNNWLSASGRLSSMSFYSMLSSSLSNLSISAFNYKLEFGKCSLFLSHDALLQSCL